MIALNSLTNSSRPKKNIQRVGRGPGSNRGRTCGRGEKGAGSRSGYKRRFGYEGGQMRLFMKLPLRGFSNARFRTDIDVVNLGQIQSSFKDGDTVNKETLFLSGLITGKNKVKILGEGSLTKKVSIAEIDAVSAGAREKLQNEKIAITVVE
jgi:large subunit ribosomal protein L15